MTSYYDVITVVTVYIEMVDGVSPSEKEKRCHCRSHTHCGCGLSALTIVVVVAEEGEVRVAVLVVTLSELGEVVVVVGVVVDIWDVYRTIDTEDTITIFPPSKCHQFVFSCLVLNCQ